MQIQADSLKGVLQRAAFGSGARAKVISLDAHRRLLWLPASRALSTGFSDRRRGIKQPRGASAPHRERRRVPVRAAAMAGLGGLSLLAAGCGSSPGSHVAQISSSTMQSNSSSNSPTASAQASGALTFSRCMRTDGVPNYPDPTNGGTLVKESLQQLGVSGARFQAAVTACNHLLPNGGSGPSPAQVQQARAQALRFSQCVRRHGVAGFPDPASNGRIPDPATAGINQGSPKFQAANQACANYRPPYMPSNAAYNAYARTHG